MAFGQYLRRVREEKGATLTEVARKVDVSIAYLSRIERERENPPPDRLLMSIARALGAGRRFVWRGAATTARSASAHPAGYRSVSAAVGRRRAVSIDVAYPHDATSYDPRPIKAHQIWSVAEQVRRQLTPRPQMPCLDLGRLTRSGQKLRVNGVEYATHLDFERTVFDGRGREALGVTEADPAVPGAVLISLNGAVIGDRDYLKRSTLAHELGRALFDGPSMIRQAGKPAFALVTPNEQHLVSARRG
ncbi:MAG: helix-turn-helix domain-containing protein [Reyranella sp.]|uniref:helix-turn-helix domain-containing protein n=1 Tax=Reyranella sp. TaxID=1929291 RepID=UPI003D0B6071